MRYIDSHLKNNPLETPETICYCPITPTRDAIISSWQKATGEKLSCKPYLGATTLTKLSKQLWLIGPGIGGAAACLYTEPFLISGCEKLLLFGTCASLDENELQIGDLFSPTNFVGEENIAHFYSQRSYSLQPSRLSLDLKDMKIKHGPLWTTDIPNFESPEKSKVMRAIGAIAVEMEVAPLAAMSQNYRCAFEPYLVITDILGEQWTRGFTSSAVKQSIENVAQVITSTYLNH